MRFIKSVIIGCMCCLPMAAIADVQEFALTIKDHQFAPTVLKIPANQKVKIVVDNQDATPEEFESYDLNREKVIGGGKKGAIFMGPLKSGKYPFVGEFHAKTAKGTIEVE